MTGRFVLRDTPLEGVSVIERTIIEDDRGYLERLYCADELRPVMHDRRIVQITHTMTAARGTVRYAGALRGYGNLILITHPNGYVTAYAHAENITVARGDEVGRGQVIGTAGKTGGVDRPQLHFEIRHGVTPIDPRLLLAANT